jgi:alpha-D-ribose 1-methylphosphonate 5-triphosphate synthase subunit PhnI
MPEPFTAEKRAEFLDYLQKGMMRGAAAFVLELTRSQVEGYIAEHPEFALEVRDAEETATEHVHEAVYQAAVSGNVAAAKLWLGMQGCRHRPGPTPPDQGGGDPELDAALGDLE